MRQARNLLNLNQIQGQQRQIRAATEAANGRRQDEASRNQARIQVTQSRAALAVSQRKAREQLNRLEMQGGIPQSNRTILRSAETPHIGLAESLNNKAAERNHGESERVRRFEHAAKGTTFYFPNDPERRYKWVKMSPTMARNLVNGRTAFLPAGIVVIVASGQPVFPGFWGGPEPVYDSLAGYGTLRVSNPYEYGAQVNLRSGSQNVNLNVAANSTGSVQLPDGTYQVFFQFSDRPGHWFHGDDVSLHGNIAEIQLVNVAGGDCGPGPVN